MKPEESPPPAPFSEQRGELPFPSRRKTEGKVHSDFANKNPIESSLRALGGLSEYARRSRRNWLYQVFISIAVVGVALWTGLDAVRLALVILSIALVLAIEILNTALEVLLNWLKPEYHAVAKTAKDLAAGAVLIVSLGAVGAGFLLFWTPVVGLTYEHIVLKMIGSVLIILLSVLAWASGRAKR
ncbi:diacylglycerol kinase [Candidatus Acetothermia bacterium]|nr:diacylglycerol kinase [Candidatus Acetothermia bacterium]